MKPWKLLLLILLAGAAIGCLVSPLAYWTAGRLAPSSSIAASLYERSFPRFVNRSIMVSALVLVALCWRPLVRGRPTSLGLERGPHWRGQLAAGFIFGAASLLIFTLLMVYLGARVVYLDPAGKIVGGVLSALVTCAVVGFLEEVFFRGFFMGSIMEKGRVTMAVVVSSAFYASQHFFKLKDGSAPEGLDMLAGFRTLSAMLSNFSRPLLLRFPGAELAVPFGHFLPKFLGLFLLGVVLALLYLWTRSLYCSIGLHAGFVFVIQAQRPFLNRSVMARESVWLYGGSDYVDGLLGWAFLLAALFALRFIVKRRGWKSG